MQISARNQLKGTVRSVKLGTIMSEVLVEVGGQQIVAAVTRGSAESLGLQEGSEVIIIIKATEVNDRHRRLSPISRSRAQRDLPS
jgi:molybdopterin-binding protein